MTTARRSERRTDVTALLVHCGLRWGRGLRSLDLVVRAGEVVCVAGLPGSDAESFTRAVGGGIPRRGEVISEDRVLPDRLHGSIRQGRLALVPADRKQDGLFLDLTAAENIGATALVALSRARILLGRTLDLLARRMMGQLHVQPPEPARPVRTFSGGNQQKALIARCLSVGIRILLADEPTRGVDIATKGEIHLLLRRFADGGGACVIYSSDLHEVADIADRVVVLGRDGAVREVPSGRSPEELFSLMGEAA
jgi:ABC-type sugar transport system ATPase subunit